MKRFTMGLAVVALYAFVFACDGDDTPSKETPKTKTKDGGQDGAPDLCSGDSECSDGLFCNGFEHCDKGAKDADERGCVKAESGPCAEGTSCDETKDKCVACADNDDLDGDNHKSIACGGDDCDDNDPRRYPGNAEVCDDDDHDEDCNPTTFGERDVDGDGALDEQCCNSANNGKLNCGDDCDDTTFVRQPKQVEICDDVDNDCDGETDEETNEVNWYPDGDGDGFGEQSDETKKSCEPLEGYSLKDTDCDDEDAARHPGQIDLCDEIDNDCDDKTDEDVPCDVAIKGTVGAEGGEVGLYAQGRIVLGAEISKNSLNGGNEIEIKQVEDPVNVSEQYQMLGPTYAFSAKNAGLTGRIIIVLPVVAGSESDILVLYLPDESQTEWQTLTPLSIGNGVVEVKADGWGCFRLVTVVEEQDAGEGTGGSGASGGAGGSGGSGASGGAGGSGGSGGSSGSDFLPLCNSVQTAAGQSPAKNVACAAGDPQICYKECGPETWKGMGYKSETCVNGVYVEQPGCTFLTGIDYSCYAIPATIDPTCPTTIPQAGQPCDVAYCVLCNLNGQYYTTTAELKEGYCVCPEDDHDWSCASITAWPCPGNEGCSSP
ncbi:MAG: putative metal-binding motif-containing protein [Deltaproteobacteria bacterium]|nr:putative metal-binding motif-containing protein [Deltaproteobacteria bacterium]